MTARRPIAFLLVVALAMPSLALAGPTAAQIQAAQKLAQAGQAAYRAVDYEKAAQSYADALRSMEHEDLFFMYGRSLEQLGRFAEAAFAYERTSARLKAGPRRTTVDARATAMHQLDAGVRAFADDQAAATRQLREAHQQLAGQAMHAEDGQAYAEPASARVALARAEIAGAQREAAVEHLVAVLTDPTAPESVKVAARKLRKALPQGPAAAPPSTPKPAETPPPPVVHAAEPAPATIPPPPVARTARVETPKAEPERLVPPKARETPDAARSSQPARPPGKFQQWHLPPPDAKLVEEPPQFYETWWFWTAVGVAVVGTTAAVVSSSGSPPAATGFTARIIAP